MAETIRFTAGKPEILALRFGSGKLVAGKFGEQMMYSTTCGRAFYLDPEPARDVETELGELGIRVGEEFSLTKVKTAYGKHEYRVERTFDAGGHNRPDRMIGQGAQTIQASAPRTLSTTAEQFEQQPHPIAQPAATRPQIGRIDLPAQPPAPTTHTARMMACFMAALDAVHEAQEYARRKGIGITFSSDNVTSAALSCYINDCKGGAR